MIFTIFYRRSYRYNGWATLLSAVGGMALAVAIGFLTFEELEVAWRIVLLAAGIAFCAASNLIAGRIAHKSMMNRLAKDYAFALSMTEEYPDLEDYCLVHNDEYALKKKQQLDELDTAREQLEQNRLERARRVEQASREGSETSQGFRDLLAYVEKRKAEKDGTKSC